MLLRFLIACQVFTTVICTYTFVLPGAYAQTTNLPRGCIKSEYCEVSLTCPKGAECLKCALEECPPGYTNQGVAVGGKEGICCYKNATPKELGSYLLGSINCATDLDCSYISTNYTHCCDDGQGGKKCFECCADSDCAPPRTKCRGTGECY